MEVKEMKRKGVAALLVAIAALPAAAQYKQINLVGDNPGMATYTDPNLKDPWGLGFIHDGPFFIANKDTGTVTVYYRNGQQVPVIITIPAAANQPPGTPGSPTGLVTNATWDFVISKNGKSGPARIIVDTLDGLICGWNPDVDPANAVVMIDNSKLAVPASYTALTSSLNKDGRMVLYAADSGAGPGLVLSNNQIMMFDGKLNLIGHFGDPLAPSNMTVFGAQNIDGKIYVTYAAFSLLQGGVADVFDREGHLLKRFAANSPAGPLEEPWAFVLAPKDFGRFGGALLIGNLGDGRIKAYNRETGQVLGQLQDDHRNPISSGEGLWSLSFGNGWGEGESAKSRLFFTSGVNNEIDGLFGYIVPTN
jgi:uncharacterized protein (TIGR03118 family)